MAQLTTQKAFRHKRSKIATRFPSLPLLLLFGITLLDCITLCQAALGKAAQVVFLVSSFDHWAQPSRHKTCLLRRADLARARLVTVDIVPCHIETPPNTHTKPHAIFLTIRF